MSFIENPDAPEGPLPSQPSMTRSQALRPDGVLEYPGTLSGDEYDRIKQSWFARHQGPGNANRTAWPPPPPMPPPGYKLPPVPPGFYELEETWRAPMRRRFSRMWSWYSAWYGRPVYAPYGLVMWLILIAALLGWVSGWWFR